MTLGRRRFRFRTWTFTVISNKVTKPVRQFKLPRVLFVFVFILILIPIGLLYHYVTMNEQLLLTNTSLEQEISSLERNKRTLVTNINHLTNEREHVIERFLELGEIEETIHQYMNGLPEEALGGIEIPLNEENSADLQTISPEDLLFKTDEISRYHHTISSIEMLETNLLYIPTHWPTDPNKITSIFGPRNDPFNRRLSIHSGIDVRGQIGTPIYAAADGTIQFAQYNGGYGNMIIINHGGRYETLYAHLSKIDVEAGDKVRKGDVIGALGSTGRSTGPHLHYEVIKDGVAVDPELYLNFFSNEIN